MIEPKSRSGKRTVPIAKVLREHLIAHRLRSGRSTGLAFGRVADSPFHPSWLWRQAHKAWDAENVKRAKKELDLLQPIGFHECRHTFASLMIAAGCNAKALTTYMGTQASRSPTTATGTPCLATKGRLRASSTATSTARLARILARTLSSVAI